MNLRTKMLGVIVFAFVLVVLSAAFLISSISRTTQQIEIVDATLSDVFSAVRARSLINHQMREAMDYLFSGRAEEREKFMEYGRSATQALQELLDAETALLEKNTGGTEEDVLDVKELIISYTQVTEEVELAFEHFNVGDHDGALKVMEAIESSIEDELNQAIDDIVAHDVDQIMGSYDGLLLIMGSLPWAIQANWSEIIHAEKAIEEFLAADDARSGIQRQAKELVDILISEEAEERDEFAEQGYRSRAALRRWIGLLEERQERDVGGEGQDNSRVGEVLVLYEQMTTAAARAFDLIDEGAQQEAFELIEAEVEALVDDKLLPLLTAAINDEREEIEVAHASLVASNRAAVLFGVVVLVLLVLPLFLIPYLVLRSILRSVVVLEKGAKNVGAGDLDHRINIGTQDELGQLASSINTMSEQLAQMSNYKSEFMATVSHELRTPLTSILLLSKMLADDEEKTLTDEQVYAVDTISFAGQNLAAIIDDILDLSRVEAGKITVELEKVSLLTLIENNMRQFDPVAEEKSIEFRLEKKGKIPHYIETDVLRAGQILRNLLSNAFKFTESGSVTIVVGEPGVGAGFSQSSLSHRRMVAYSIIDTGIGIPEEKQQLIFEAFRQVDGTTARTYGGTGLGLAISARLAQLLGGEIQVESEEGKGSTFTLYLPYEIQTASSDDMVRVKASDSAPRPRSSSDGELSLKSANGIAPSQ
ncbi:MAG: HAMP domain-containing protein [Bacteroidetes bacterium]|nr:HAMP domain-containing protein [Bacteroidota bacterium]